MPSFKYSAIGTDGRTVRGTLDAGGQQELLDELRRRNLTPLKVEGRRAGMGGGAKPKRAAPVSGTGKGLLAKKPSLLTMDIGGNKPGVKKKEEIVLFTRQLSTMISAGIPLLECLEILQEQAQSRQFALLLDYVISDVRSGEDLSSSLDKHPKVFSEVYVSMVKAGEASGQIDEILVRLAEYLEASQRLKRDIKSAMTYPVVSLTLILGITAFLMLSIVPKFKDVFASLDVDLPALTAAILGASDWSRAHWDLVLIGMVLGIMLLVVYRRTERGRYQLDWLALHVPIFGPLFQKVGLSRFSKTFSTMLKSGVPILGALEIVAETSGNRIIAEAVLHARENVRQGENLADPLSESPVFPPMVTRMISIGEKSGSLEMLLEKISEFYDEQVRATVKQLTSLIEPIMISVMGLLVGTIVLAVFLPIFEIQKQLGTR